MREIESKERDTMDIKKKIEELVKKITEDKTLLTKFKKDPVKTVEGLLNVDLDDDLVEKIVAGVKAKIDLDKIDDLLDGLKGKVDLDDVAGALGGLFGKKK